MSEMMVLSGWLQKKQRHWLKAWQTRYVDLVGKSLIWSKRHGGVGETSRKKVLSPDSCAVFLGGKDFEVTVTKWEKVLFQAESAEAAQKWVEGINRAIQSKPPDKGKRRSSSLVTEDGMGFTEGTGTDMSKADTVKALTRRFSETFAAGAPSDLGMLYMEYSKGPEVPVRGASYEMQIMDKEMFLHFVDVLEMDRDIDNVGRIFDEVLMELCTTIQFDGFTAAMALLADEKGLDLEVLVDQVIAKKAELEAVPKIANGATGTPAGSEGDPLARFHYDESTYTSTHKSRHGDIGGKEAPTPAAADKYHKDSMRQPITASAKVMRRLKSNNTMVVHDKGQASAGAGGGLSEDDKLELKALFYQYCTFGTGQKKDDTMDRGQFAKLCKECHVVDERLDATMVDIAFTKFKGGKKKKRIPFTKFKKALMHLAAEKGSTFDSLVQGMLLNDGPQILVAV